MRKLYIIITLVLVSVFGLSAQRIIKPKFSFGGKSGMTMSRMSFSPSIPQSFILGSSFGVTFRYTEENFFGIIAELNFTQRGWKEDFEDLDFKYERQLSYIELPILTHIYFGNDIVKGFVNLGPEFSLMVGENISSNFDYSNISAVPGFPKKHKTAQYGLDIKNKFDYGITAGAGVELIAKKKHSFQIEGRFYYGLGNIFPSHKSDYFSASPGMCISVTLGYMFNL